MIRLKKVMAIVALAIFLGAVMVASAQTGQMQKNLYQAASDAGSFGMFTKIVQEAGLKDTLSTGGPYTVLAPTDTEISKIPKGVIDALTKDKSLLTKHVKSHIIQGKYTTKDLESMSSVTTLSGDKLPVRSIDGTIHVGSFKLVGPDIQSSNGIIHGVTISGFGGS
jgi:uncharacterized surface protein with fasciclin (FAS1) repeats